MRNFIRLIFTFLAALQMPLQVFSEFKEDIAKQDCLPTTYRFDGKNLLNLF